MVNELTFDQDMGKEVRVRQITGSLFEGDNEGLRLLVNVFRAGFAENLTGEIVCEIARSDGVHVRKFGSIDGNVASVVIPASAMIPGIVKMMLKNVTGTTITTLLAITGVVSPLLYDPNGQTYIPTEDVIYTPPDRIDYDSRQFMDTSSTTATVDDVRAGKFFYDSSGNKVEGVGDYAVTFGDNVTVVSLGNDDYRFDFS